MPWALSCFELNADSDVLVMGVHYMHRDSDGNSWTTKAEQPLVLKAAVLANRSRSSHPDRSSGSVVVLSSSSW